MGDTFTIHSIGMVSHNDPVATRRIRRCAITNLEAMARAVTERVCLRKAHPGEDVAAWVEAHWYIAAADLEAGLIDEDGAPLPGYTPTRARDAVVDWLRRNPR